MKMRKHEALNRKHAAFCRKHAAFNRKHYAFTIVELLVVVAIIGVLVGLLLPATRTSREAARRMSCSNQMKQLGIAIHNYHSAYNRQPPAMGGTGRGPNAMSGNDNRLSGLVATLPFLEQQELWEQINCR